MKRGSTGEWLTISTVGNEPVRAFVPRPLPPDPPLQIEGELRDSLDRALVSLGRLDGVATLLPDPALFLYGYVRREAVLSSQIEGTQSSLSDLLLFELDQAPGAPPDDVTEVSSSVAALEHGRRRLAEGFPLSSRLLREVHGVLLARGRGAKKEPGEFRRSQNWIGGSRPANAIFVPPPPERIDECMGALEAFIHHKPARASVLVKTALAHVQFETIHPFLDGNGRVGRLLIALLLLSEGVLREPLLYLSLFFKQHRSTYYDLLQRVRIDGDFEAWLEFFADGVRQTADGAVATARRIADLFAADRASLAAEGRSTRSGLQVLRFLQNRPLASISVTAAATGLSIPTVGAAFELLVARGIAREITGKRRNRVYAYDCYLAILSEGTEP